MGRQGLTNLSVGYLNQNMSPEVKPAVPINDFSYPESTGCRIKELKLSFILACS